ncbi:hypothetical protein K469DRAFT_745230 [Zopfia rhizophila CBS 207.26]|uniref:DUF7730 domain-containing protein n=1 Tax=Zopfia rhizophila CBS 207.26 TaxID=1314779 RepID=A0A6A6ESP7_9PEZI|nr:hypothetical protein K469DRAFT_745230 [Zopfia rhizophila CBS 207.26]
MALIQRKSRSFTGRIRRWFREHKRIKNALIIIVCCPVIVLLNIYVYVERCINWILMKYHRKFVVPALYPPRNLLSEKEIEERRKKREERNLVKPLPAKRPRALTLGGDEMEKTLETEAMLRTDAVEMNRPPTEAEKKKGQKKSRHLVQSETVVRQTTVDQLSKCDFWKLPFEIREQIWKYAVGGHHIHILKRKGRLGNAYCPATDSTDPDRRDFCCLPKDENGFTVPTAWPRDTRPLGLMMSCRQIYSETINFLYSHNTFSFDDFNVLIIFTSNILPHRLKLVSSIHISWCFTRNDRPYAFNSRSFVRIPSPPNDNLETWQKCCRILDTLPSLKSLKITPSLPYDRPSGRDFDLIQTFLSKLNDVYVDGPFEVSIPWPDKTHIWVPARWSNNNRILPWPQNPNFELRTASFHDKLEFLAFFFPFHVQCLHCSSYTIIRKSTPGFAESILTRIEYPTIFNNNTATTEPVTTRYWTFHGYCQGWIEFQYDWVREKWSVVQGAQEIGDEEAERHLAENEKRYPELESAHERLQGLTIKSHPTYSAYGDTSGKAIDVPSKTAFYRNVGWSRS